MTALLARIQDWFGRPLNRFIERLRLRLAQPDALLQVTLLGLIAGLLAALLVVAFRLALEGLQVYGLGLPGAERYESLPAEWRLLLPILGALVLGLAFHLLPFGMRNVGVGHVIIRFHRFGADMPWQNAVVQFVAGIWGLLIGLTGGREGPGIHLGAFSGSLLGHSLGLPNNSVRTLSGCGVAAAISAAFNTPLAGVIFALEVVIKQYTLASFLPVILASSMGALLATTVFGPETLFTIEIHHQMSFWEVPTLLALGLIIGAMAAGYIQIVEGTIARSWDWPVWARFTAAGVATGIIGFWVPEILGIGHDTTDLVAAAELTLGALLIIAVAKWLLASVTVGLGLPIGTIAPVLMIGAVVGGTLGSLLYRLDQIPLNDVAFYTVLGMGAMMGATLQAPLAALAAVLELTSDTGAILPAMITIVVSGLVSRMVFGKSGLYDAILRANDQQMPGPSLWFNGDNIGVSSIIERRVAEVNCPCNLARFEQALEEKPAWLVIRDEHRQAMGVIRYAAARAAFDHVFNQALFDAQARAEAEQAARDSEVQVEAEAGADEAPESTASPAHDSSEAGERVEPSDTTETASEEQAEPGIDMEALADQVREEVLVDPAEISGFYRAADVEVGYTLTQAQRVMREEDVGVLVARRMLGSPQARTLGVMTAAMLEQAIVER
ncbi:chloride channel protein [Guyparkeria sp. SB14A]|uniref:chloride channel protein n=1 Tax=Guyparkeria sp. SB14A TaxID=2571147 RepID=UPI0010ABFFBB|nr:chloride channel protein [Guyparkeria sp. SB14A]TKA89076.1 chloride channel protein [Guyparkeria sp. SB14A]